MDVPEARKDLTVHNLKWLARNLAIRNRNHVDFPMSIHLVQTLLVMMGENPSCVLGAGLTEEVITPQKAAELLGQEPPFEGLNRSEN